MQLLRDNLTLWTSDMQVLNSIFLSCQFTCFSSTVFIFILDGFINICCYVDRMTELMRSKKHRSLRKRRSSEVTCLRGSISLLFVFVWRSLLGPQPFIYGLQVFMHQIMKYWNQFCNLLVFQLITSRLNFFSFNEG